MSRYLLTWIYIFIHACVNQEIFYFFRFPKMLNTGLLLVMQRRKEYNGIIRFALRSVYVCRQVLWDFCPERGASELQLNIQCKMINKVVKDTLEPKAAWSSESLSKMPIIIKKRHSWISDSRSTPKPVFSPPENPYEFSKLSILNWSNGMFLELQKWQNTPGLFHPSGLGSSALSNPSTCSMDPCCANSANIFTFILQTFIKWQLHAKLWARC